MSIAIDLRFIEEADYLGFLREVFVNLAEKCPDHHFIFFADRLSDRLNYPANTEEIVVSSNPQSVIAKRWWQYIKLPLELKKQNSDVLFCAAGIISGNTPVPQIAVAFNAHTSKADKNTKQTFTNKSLKKAKAIITLSDLVKTELTDNYNIPSEIITAAKGFVSNAFKPVDWEEHELTKDKFAQGCEYFLFTGGFDPANNIINVLKAFSIFKKWQKTNLKLLIIGNQNGKYEKEIEKLETYKYRNEVFLLSDLSLRDETKIYGSAYALVSPTPQEKYQWNIVKALSCEVPIIASDNAGTKEMAGEAALYVEPGNPQQIADEMKRIFKDEQLRSKLIATGRTININNVDEVADLFWQTILKSVSQ